MQVLLASDPDTAAGLCHGFKICHVGKLLNTVLTRQQNLVLLVFSYGFFVVYLESNPIEKPLVLLMFMAYSLF